MKDNGGIMRPGAQDWVYAAEFNREALKAARKKHEEALVWRFPAARERLRELLTAMASTPDEPVTREDLVLTVRALTEFIDARLQTIHGDLNCLAEAAAPNRHKHRTLSDFQAEEDARDAEG